MKITDEASNARAGWQYGLWMHQRTTRNDNLAALAVAIFVGLLWLIGG